MMATSTRATAAAISVRSSSLVGAAALLVAFFANSCAPAPYSCRDCNVVLISADTLRADHVGAYGYAKPTTPHIDALAARGVLFENAVSQSSWTRPAHFSMFTGLYPNEHGVVALKDRGPPAREVVTLASALFTRGYRTAAFTGGVNLSAAFGFDRGFESYRSNGKFFRDNLAETKLWLDEHQNEKFFLFWHGYDPHTPYFSDPMDRAALATPSRPEIGLRRACRAERLHHVVAQYADEYDAAIHRADRYVGKLLDELAARGLMERTLIVFTSDHGEEFVEHGGCFHMKTLYREVLHVPLVVVGPGLASRRVAALVPASVSIGPTILAIVGNAGAALPGPSLAAALTSGKHSGDAEVVSETSRDPSLGGNGHLRALTAAGGKLIHSVDDDRYTYFDYASDPAEQNARATGTALDILRTRLAAWLDLHPSREALPGTTPVTQPSGAEALDEQLRSLGYRE